MNFDQESKSEDFLGVWGGGEEGDSDPKKINNRYLFIFLCSCSIYIKFQVPGASGSLVLIQTKGVTDR